MKRLIYPLMAVALMLVGCGDENPTQPPDGDGEGTLLLDRLVVSMVSGGSESVTVHARDATGSPIGFTVSNSDPEIASFTISDSTLHITGLAYGTSDLTVTTESGRTSTLPVQVYNQFVLDTGELLVTFVDEYTQIWNLNFSFWEPEVPEGFQAVGSMSVGGDDDPSGRYAMMVVKAKEGSDALAHPVGYHGEVHWNVYLFPMSIWTPIAPEGYVALGSVVRGSFTEPPPLDYVVCVREDLTIAGEAAGAIWELSNLGLYHIEQPDAGPHELCYLKSGTFIGLHDDSRPQYHPVLHVLKVDLPMLAEAPYQNYLPQLTSFEEPPLESPPVMAKAMLVPCTIVNDLPYSNNLHWRIANSPLYRLERQVFYRRQYHNHNTSSEPQSNFVSIISGVTTEESESFWSETSVSVTVEAGISIKAFTGKVTTTVSKSFGYQSQTSVAELEQKEVRTSINMGPQSAAACWQKFNRYVLYRHDGVDLEPVSSWEFGIDSYVVDDYPD